MKLIDKEAPDQAVHLPWDAAQAALASGAYDAHQPEGERGPDQPAAQSPAPGVDPKDGSLGAGTLGELTNMTGLATSSTAPGLPQEPNPQSTVVTAEVLPGAVAAQSLAAEEARAAAAAAKAGRKASNG